MANGESVGKTLALIMVPLVCVMLGWGATVLIDKGVIDTRSDSMQQQIDELRTEENSLRATLEMIQASQSRQEVLLQKLSDRENLVLRRLNITGFQDNN